MAWFNSSWTYRKKITISSTEVPLTQTNFPVYVDLADLGSSFFTNAKSDGSDIRVTTSDETTEVPIDVVSYDNSTETGRLQFKAPSIASSTDTEFYVYYGNSGATAHGDSDTNGKNNVYDSSISAHYNLDNDLNDSTSNGNDLTATGATATSSGIVDGAYDFDGVNDKLRVASADAINTDTSGIIIFSAKPDTLSQAYAGIFTTADESVNNKYIFGGIHSNGAPFVQFRNGGGASRIISNNLFATTGTNAHVAIRSDGTSYQIFLNGVGASLTVDVGSNDGTWFGDVAGRDAFTLGLLKINSESLPWDGLIDEVLITSSTEQSFIETHYNNNFATADFYSVGLEETDTIAFAIDKSTLSLSGGDVALSVGKTNSIEQSTLSLSSGDVAFSSDITLSIDNSTLSLSGGEISNTSGLTVTIDRSVLNLTGNDVAFSSDLSNSIEQSTLSLTGGDIAISSDLTATIDRSVLNLTGRNINNLVQNDSNVTIDRSFLYLTGQDIFTAEITLNPDLITARNDVTEILNEIGDFVIYRRLSRTFFDDGQLKQLDDEEHVIKAMLNTGDSLNRSNGDIGEHIVGEQRLNLPHVITTKSGATFSPKINDMIQIRGTNIWYRIKSIDSLRMFGGVIDNDCVIERVTSDQVDYE